MAGTVEFTVTAYDVQPTYGALNNSGMDKFYFNFDDANVSSAPSAWALILPDNWGQWNNGGNASEFGDFAVYEKGTGSSRQSPLEFTIQLSQPSEAVADYFAMANSDGFLFAAHLGGINADGGDLPGSHWMAAVDAAHAPVPGAAMLGIVGLAVLSRFRRSGLLG